MFSLWPPRSLLETPDSDAIDSQRRTVAEWSTWANVPDDDRQEVAPTWQSDLAMAQIPPIPTNDLTSNLSNGTNRIGGPPLLASTVSFRALVPIPPQVQKSSNELLIWHPDPNVSLLSQSC